MNLELKIIKQKKLEEKYINQYYRLFNSINKDNILKSIDLEDMEQALLSSNTGVINISQLKIRRGWFNQYPLYKTIKSFESLKENELDLKLMKSKILYIDTYLDEKYIYHFDYTKINGEIFNILQEALLIYNPKLLLYINDVNSIELLHRDLC